MAGSQSSLREANRARVVEAVKRHGGLTQVELAGATGLSQASISTIVKELVAAELFDVRNTVRSGRRAQLVTLAHQTGLVSGVVVGRRQLRVAVADVSHEVLAEQVMPLADAHRADTSLDRVALLIVELLDRLGTAMDELQGIGVALPAPVDAATGQVSVRGVLRGWDNVPVAQVLTKRLARPVFVDNDANLGALAESTLGAAREARDAIYVRVGHGVGAGIVLGGRVHRGVAGTAGEIGHVQVDPAGRICSCGSRGCLNTVVGEEALLEALRTSHGSLTLRDVVRLANDDDPGCRSLVRDAGATVGRVVANVATAFNPERIVVGGELAETGDVFLEPFREMIQRQSVLQQAEPPVDVVASDLGARAELEGALSLVLQHIDVFETREGVALPPQPQEELL
ncbi:MULTISPECIES: ROK family transcriptional regulator [unclassified Isoptericola]|uniref:ROK family transcriptional regulator n=1 Tax=unclassified Isoptericola TaxID=2623355 RepID=UPI0036510074